MKLLVKISYVTFWMSNAALLVYIIGLPVFLVNVPDAFDKLIANHGLNLYTLGMMFLSAGSFFNWCYCIWFLFKYDRYSASIFPLFMIGAVYAPIYFYRVRIKKRPLRNKIKV